MSDLRITVRLNADLMRALEDEAKDRTQSVAALCRTFISDGIARYDEINERIVRNEELMLKALAEIQSLSGALLHVSLEQKARLNKKNPEESDADYSARLSKIFSLSIWDSMAKGDLILKSTREKSKK